MAAKIVIFLEEMRYILLLDSQMGRLMEKLGKVHWEGQSVQIVELREYPL